MLAVSPPLFNGCLGCSVSCSAQATSFRTATVELTLLVTARAAGTRPESEASQNEVTGGTVRAMGNDEHYTVTTRGGTVLVGIRRTDLLLKWQVGAVTSERQTAAAAIRAELQVIIPSGGGGADDAASIARSSGVTSDGVGDLAAGTTAVPLAGEVR